jgi:hypothetical protein
MSTIGIWLVGPLLSWLCGWARDETVFLRKFATH